MANWQTGQARNFSQAYGYEKASPNFNYLRDDSATWTSPNGQSYTGGWRPLVPADLAANISLSGVSINVGAVAVTGNPQVQISNPILAVSGNFGGGGSAGLITGGYIGITGTPNVNVVNNTGLFLPFFTGITGSQTQIPAGVRAWSVAVESGSAYVNGLLINNPTILSAGGYGNILSSNVINVGCTGSVSSPSRVVIIWET